MTVTTFQKLDQPRLALPYLLFLPLSYITPLHPSHSIPTHRSLTQITAMPPKFNPDDPATASLITLFTSLGVAPASATELVKQPKQGQAFKGLIDEFKLEETEYKGKLDEKQGAALVKLATTGGKLGQAEKGFVVQKVLKGDLKSGDQVTGEYCTVE